MFGLEGQPQELENAGRLPRLSTTLKKWGDPFLLGNDQFWRVMESLGAGLEAAKAALLSLLEEAGGPLHENWAGNAQPSLQSSSS